MSLSDLGADLAARRATSDLIAAHGMRLILGLYSGWDDYQGPWAPSSPGAHVSQLGQQLTQAERLGAVVTHLNIHSGCDSWDERSAVAYFRDALPLTSAFLEANPHVGAASREVDTHGSQPTHLTGASHETHRGRILHHPYATLRLLETFPPLRLTADLSHWHVVCERLIGQDDPDERSELHDNVAFHVDHVHARIGGTQASQQPPAAYAPAATAAERAAAAACHEALWRACWTHKAARGVAEVTVTPEYGPYPYQTVGGDPELWAQTLAAGEHLRRVFADWVAETEHAAPGGV